MYGGDEVSAIVIDMGSTCTKAGYAGEDCPKYVIPSHVGTIGEGSGAERRAGTNALSVRADGMPIEAALSDGVVTNWDAAEELLNYTYSSCLSCNPADHPLLLAEANHNTKEAREKMAELAFEKLGVPALFLSKSSVLTAFASGRGTALVLDIGGGVASAAAVHDGYLLRKSVRRHGLGGDVLNELILRSTQLRSPAPPLLPLYTLKRTEVGPGEYNSTYIDYPGTHPAFHKYHLLQLFRDIKESACRCHMIAPTEQIPLETSKWDHEMPDRSSLDISWERCHMPELLFNPMLLRQTPPPWLVEGAEGAVPNAAAGAAELAGLVPEGVTALPDLVTETIRGCDTDMRRELWGSIIISGGCSLLPGLTERLHGRLNELVPQMSMKVKVIAPTSPQERRFSVWIGGSILASLGSFQQLWMSKQEYDEVGAAGIEAKCP